MKNAAENVQPINDGTGNLKKYFQKESVSLFFMSNFLEHIGKDEIVDLLKAEHELLHENGELWVLTPNIRYTGGKYWDFFDHITPLTEKSIIEAAEMCGFKTKKCIKKFLPFTTKSRLPQSGWIVKLYLKLMPLSGFFFGEQSFIVFEK
jgi:predicted SAM-dependent methyltransferase